MKRLISISFLSLSSFALAMMARAASVQGTLQNVATGNQGDGGAYNKSVNEFTLSNIIGTGVSVVLGLLGVVFLILTIMAGFNYMTSQGEEAKTKKAIDTLRTSVIGLVIVTTAYAIWRYLITNLMLGA